MTKRDQDQGAAGMQWRNTLLDDVAGAVGFTATVLLAAIHGGNSLYVPERAADGHPLVLLLGRGNFARLAEEFGGQTIHVPLLNDFDRWRAGVMAAAMHRNGASFRAIGAALGVTKLQAETMVHMVQPLRPRLRMRADHNMAAWCRTRLRVASATGVSVVDQAQLPLFPDAGSTQAGAKGMHKSDRAASRKAAPDSAGDPGDPGETRVRAPADFHQS